MPGRSTGSPLRDVNFAAAMQQRIVDALLAFKFWIDDPFFPGPPAVQPVFFGVPIGPTPEPAYPGDTDAISAGRKASPMWTEPKALTRDMTYWSENHQLLFATAEYLAGQWLPDELFQPGRPYRADLARGPRPGDRIGRERMAHARPRLLRWLDDRLRLGLSEWNSPVYYAEDVKPLLNLADFCTDHDIRDRAVMVLDRTLFDLARFSLGGDFGATAGRCYFSAKACGHNQSVADLAEVAFGNRDGVVALNIDEAAASFVTSTGYSVPDVLVDIANDRPSRLIDRTRVSVDFDDAGIYGAGFRTPDDAMFWWSRGAYFGSAVIGCTADTVQQYHLDTTPPFDQLPKIFKARRKSEELPSTLAFSPAEADALADGSNLTRANLYTFKNAHAMLSSVQNFRPGQLSAQAHACQATLGPGAVVWTTHLSAGGAVQTEALVDVLSFAVGGPVATIVANLAGATEAQEVLPPNNADGPNWWTGSASLPRVVQHEGAAIIAYNPTVLGDIFGEQTHAWFPRLAFGDTVRETSAENGNVDDGNWTFGAVGDGYVGLFSARAVTASTDGPWAQQDLLAEPGRNVFILQVGDVAGFGSYDAFVQRVSNARVHVNGLHWGGSDFECSYDIPGGGRLELHWDDDEVRYDGARFSDGWFPRFETPYVRLGRVAWDQYAYTIELGGYSLTHDFTELKTVANGARVHRALGGPGYDGAADALWVVSRRGSAGLLPENTVDACAHAVEVDGANGLAVDVCVTVDDQLVLWVDADPDSEQAMARAAGTADVGRYRPAAPAVLDPLRRPIAELTLAEFRAHYGYLTGAVLFETPLPPSTLVEMLARAGDWTGLRHIVLRTHLARDQVGSFARVLDRALDPASDYDVTVLVDDGSFVAELTAALAGSGVLVGVQLDVAARPLSGDERFSWNPGSAVATALDVGCPIASLGVATPAPGLEYDELVWSDAMARMAFNLDPRRNAGRQLDRLLVQAIPGGDGAALLVDGVSGVVTDDVPSLRAAMASDNRW